MPKFKIFTESKADIKFLQDYISAHFANLVPEDFSYPLNSWAGYKSDGQVIASIQENFEKGKETILILDADNNFAARRSEVLNDFQGFNIPVHLFLFPNNALSGSLETALCAVAVKRDILMCFEDYEDCIRDYESPVIKSKVFAYLDALLPSANKKNDKNDLIQDAKRNYKNAAHWNLHHKYLNPLRNFLQQFSHS
jgi:hypothetical protein